MEYKVIRKAEHAGDKYSLWLNSVRKDGSTDTEISDLYVSKQDYEVAKVGQTIVLGVMVVA